MKPLSCLLSYYPNSGSDSATYLTTFNAEDLISSILSNISALGLVLGSLSSNFETKRFMKGETERGSGAKGSLVIPPIDKEKGCLQVKNS